MVTKKPIIVLCRNIRASFFLAINKPNIASALMLGNLYLGYPYCIEEERLEVSKTIEWLKGQMNVNTMHLLWNKSFISKNRFRVMDEANQQSILSLQKAILRDIDWYQHLSTAELFKIGCHVGYYRDLLIAIIRKHLAEQKLSDPFKKDFSYEKLDSAGTEVNYLYLASFIVKSEKLPIKEIISLGEKNEKVAELILKDLTGSSYYFEISAAFAKCHPSLRKSIAEVWKNHLESFPLPEKIENQVTTKLQNLKSQYDEFGAVDTKSRVVRHENNVQPKKPDTYLHTLSKFFSYTKQYISYSIYQYRWNLLNMIISIIIRVSLRGSVLGSTVLPVLTPMISGYRTLTWLSQRFRQNNKSTPSSLPKENISSLTPASRKPV